MTFEEFFQKKRIDLTKLQTGEPALFFEFKKHFEQMGEKSFDHTKKYWFNKLRLQYHLAADLKPEKVLIENRLAEQTIVETLTESVPAPSSKKVESLKSEVTNPEETATPRPAFKPRFSPKMVAPKPAEEAEDVESKAESAAPETSAEPATPKPAGFKPRFNPKMVAQEPAEEVEGVEQKAESIAPETPAEPVAPKPAGFKPRFNAKTMAPKVEETESLELPKAETPAEPVAPKPAGFKPRFNAKAMAPKPEEAQNAEPPKAESIEPATENTKESVAAKPAGFKPRFNMKMVAPKPAEEAQPKVEMSEPATPQAPADAKAEIPATSEEAPAEEATPKPVGFKPRFNAAKMKPKPPQE